MWISVEKCGYNKISYHKPDGGVEKYIKMCINLSTVETMQNKGFFLDNCKTSGKKVDIFHGIPQVIHKLSTKCG